MADSRNYKFLFIAGLHKSGTSTLFKCLRDHPAVSGFKDTGVDEDEGQFLQTVFPLAKEYGGPGQFGFNPHMHLKEDSPLLTEANKQKLFSEWSRFWDLSKPVLIEKSPPNLLRTRFLQACFPQAYFVVITRHPVASAYATQKWSKTPIKSLLEHWTVCHNIFLEDKKYINHCLALKYEDFVQNPEKALNRIYTFVGLNRHPNQLQVSKDMNELYYQKWLSDLRQVAWSKRLMSRLEYNKIQRHVKNFGYSLFKLQPLTSP